MPPVPATVLCGSRDIVRAKCPAWRRSPSRILSFGYIWRIAVSFHAVRLSIIRKLGPVRSELVWGVFPHDGCLSRRDGLSSALITWTSTNNLLHNPSSVVSSCDFRGSEAPSQPIKTHSKE